MKLLKFTTVGALMVGLLAMVTTPASAQFADPLTLAASGVIVPFFGTGSNVSILEISSPAFANPNLHMLFFNAACNRGESFPTEQTENDVDLFLASAASAGIAVNVDGLVAIAGDAGGGLDLTPLAAAIHTRVYWINLSTNRFRILEPILVDTADSIDLANWVPLRTAATFFAPQEAPGGAQTTLYVICPRDTIQSSTGGAFPASLFPTPSASTTPVFKSSYGVGSLRARVYDVDEVFLRDWQSDCNCLQTKTLSGPAGVSSIYATADTLTEIETDGTFAGFTGYRALNFASAPQVDFFNRLSNSNRLLLRGNPAGIGGVR